MYTRGMRGDKAPTRMCGYTPLAGLSSCAALYVLRERIKRERERRPIRSSDRPASLLVLGRSAVGRRREGHEAESGGADHRAHLGVGAVL